MVKSRRRPASGRERPEATRTPPRSFAIFLTKSAETVYLELAGCAHKAEERGDPSNQHCTTFRMVDDAIHRLIPADPANQNYLLHGPLAGLYRIAKGRLRIAWAVDLERRAILILYISNTPRKEGDARDPYVILEAMVRRGYLKKIIDDWRRALRVPKDAPPD